MNEFEIEFDAKTKEFEIETELAIQEVFPELENLEVTPSNKEQNFKSEKYGFDEVTVKAVEGDILDVIPTKEKQTFNGLYETVNVKEMHGDTLEITPTEQTQNFNGIYENINVEPIQTEEKTIEVNFSNVDTLEITPTTGKYIKKTIIKKDADLTPENIKTGINIFGIEGNLADTNDADATADDILLNKTAYVANTMLRGTFKPLDTSDATATAGDILLGETAYVNGEKVTGTIQEYDGAYTGEVARGLKITDASYLFYGGARTDILYELLSLCKDITSTLNMFYNCKNLIELDVSELDTSNVTDMRNMFYNCSNLTTLNVSKIKTNNVTTMSSIFGGCKKITSLDLSSFDMSKIDFVSSMFYNNAELMNIKSFKNLGKGYTAKSNNYNSYKLDLSGTPKLSKESLVDIITNGLYDLNLTYDVANGGTLYRQSLVLGSENLAKLTTEEIAIATNKGWDVS